MNAAGVIGGTPTTSGGYGISASLTAGVEFYGRGINVNVYDVHLTTGVLASATQNATYSQPLAATGGTGSYTFTHNGGLPNGLTLSPAGLISGTVNAGPGRYGFTA
jgi:hypothetical protein